MKLKRNSSVRTKLLPDGHVVLISDDTEWAYTITPIAGIAWEYCDGTLDLDEIVKRVCELTPVKPEEIRTELESVVIKLTEAGLIEQAL